MKLASNGLDRRDDGARLGCRGWAPLVVVHSLTRASLATDACPPPALAATVHFDMELVNSLKVPASYKGVHLTFPLDREQVVNLYKSFRARKRLHAKYVCVCVCARARARRCRRRSSAHAIATDTRHVWRDPAGTLCSCWRRFTCTPIATSAP